MDASGYMWELSVTGRACGGTWGSSTYGTGGYRYGSRCFLIGSLCCSGVHHVTGMAVGHMFSVGGAEAGWEIIVGGVGPE